ncbi:MAG: sugar ABC transporter substrate-binding protein [Actinobacteria bacterium]|nr:sugar ABC transporter substrate-binding protein [Actinomycetota bacterium]
MRSRPTTLLLTTALVASLTACGSGDGGGPEPDGTTRLSLLLFGGAEEVAGYQAMLDEYEDATPDVEVELTPVGTQDDLLAKLATGFAGGIPPDVFLVNFRSFRQFADQGAIRPVQPFLDASEELSVEDFVEPPLEAFRVDGQLVCQPQNVSSLVVYYNRDLFEARDVPLPREGWTWDDFLATAEQLTGDGTYGLGTEPSLIRVAPFVWSNGGEVVDDHDAPTALALGDGPAREALDWFLDLSLVHGVVPPDVEEQSEDAESRFIAGRLGMYLNSRKSVPDLRTIDGFTWDVAPLPVAPGGAPVTMLHSDAYCIADGTGNEQAAWDLVEFAMGTRGQEILAASGRTVPSRRDVLTSPAFLSEDVPPASAEVFVDNAEIARATPSTASWRRVEKLADDILEQIFHGRIEREAGIARLLEETRDVFARAG